MYNKLWKWSGTIGITVMALAIAGMLFYSWKKPLVYVQAADGSGGQGHQSHALTGRFTKLNPMAKESAENLCIPVTNQITQEFIHIDNDYVNHVVTVTLEGMCVEDVAPDRIYGNLNGVSLVQAADWNGKLVVAVITDNIYEYEAILENQRLMLRLKSPSELYDRIVVLDAGHGGSDEGIAANEVSESELTLDIVSRVRELLSAEGIRVYVTRTAQDDPEGEKRVALANDVQADLFISLHLSQGEDYGICAWYNRSYFTPVLTNSQLADLLVRETATAVNNRGNGVYALGSDESSAGGQGHADLLYGAKRPAALLELGAPGNVDEARLLCRDDYRQDLALGIYNAVMAAYERMENR